MVGSEAEPRKCLPSPAAAVAVCRGDCPPGLENSEGFHLLLASHIWTSPPSSCGPPQVPIPQSLNPEYPSPRG